MKQCTSLTVAEINKYIKLEDATVKVLLKQVCHGLPSTSTTLPTWPIEECIQNPENNQTHEVFVTLIDDIMLILYSDQTGHFPFMSTQGNKYFIIFHVIDQRSSQQLIIADLHICK